MINIILAYAPQQGCSTEDKDEFCNTFEQVVLSWKQDEMLIIGADMNGHVGAASDGFSTVHGGKVYGNENEKGENLT